MSNKSNKRFCIMEVIFCIEFAYMEKQLILACPQINCGSLGENALVAVSSVNRNTFTAFESAASYFQYVSLLTGGTMFIMQ